MPRYDYMCKKCEIIIEVKHSISEEPVIKCENCDEQMVRVILEAPGIHFKGDGWETKDNRRARDFKRNRMRLEDENRDMKEAQPSMVPNVEGETTNTWSEAADLAKEKGYDPIPYKKKAANEATITITR